MHAVGFCSWLRLVVISPLHLVRVLCVADATLAAAERPRVARLLVWLNDDEAGSGALRASLELLIRRSGGTVHQVPHVLVPRKDKGLCKDST